MNANVYSDLETVYNEEIQQSDDISPEYYQLAEEIMFYIKKIYPFEYEIYLTYIDLGNATKVGEKFNISRFKVGRIVRKITNKVRKNYEEKYRNQNTIA